MEKLKIGDMLYCTRPVVMKVTREIRTTVGKTYKILNVIEKQVIEILNDAKIKHSFGLDKDKDNYYGKWFATLKDERKIKLKKLNKL